MDREFLQLRNTSDEVFTKPTQVLVREAIEAKPDICDKRTYLYDDGSDIDSAVVEGKKNIFGYAFENQLSGLLFLFGMVSGMALLASLMWLMLGNDLIMKLRHLRRPEDPIKWYIKYLGGGIIHLITKFFSTMRRLFSIPAQDVYQPSTDFYLWNPAAINPN